jgi:hypothetical protein
LVGNLEKDFKFNTSEVIPKSTTENLKPNGWMGFFFEYKFLFYRRDSGLSDLTATELPVLNQSAYFLSELGSSCYRSGVSLAV